MNYLNEIRKALAEYNLGLLTEDEALCRVHEVLDPLSYSVESAIDEDSNEQKQMLLAKLIEGFKE